jgi:GNAT superfamily N-acetyltransferase
VERNSGVSFQSVDATEPAAREALGAYLAEVAALIPSATVGPHELDDVDDFRPPTGGFVLVLDGDTAIGCGAVRTLEPGVGEIKRMWITPSQRRRGLGTRLLHELEDASRALGHQTLRLDTNEALVDAMRLYEAHGYVRIDRYNDNPDATHYFSKRLSLA